MECYYFNYVDTDSGKGFIESIKFYQEKSLRTRWIIVDYTEWLFYWLKSSHKMKNYWKLCQQWVLYKWLRT